MWQVFWLWVFRIRSLLNDRYPKPFTKIIHISKAFYNFSRFAVRKDWRNLGLWDFQRLILMQHTFNTPSVVSLRTYKYTREKKYLSLNCPGWWRNRYINQQIQRNDKYFNRIQGNMGRETVKNLVLSRSEGETKVDWGRIHGTFHVHLLKGRLKCRA